MACVGVAAGELSIVAPTSAQPAITVPSNPVGASFGEGVGVHRRPPDATWLRFSRLHLALPHLVGATVASMATEVSFSRLRLALLRLGHGHLMRNPGPGEPVSDNPRPGVGSHPAQTPEVAEQDLEQTFLTVVDEGRRRMARPFWPLLSTGAVGGIDVGTGVLALLLVESATHDKLLGGLAFSIGFIALTLARSELFTEDFLVPVSTVIARQARLRMLLRLWGGTLLANLAGGWVFTWFIVRGYPELSRSAIDAGSHYVQLGIGLRAFSLAVLGGAVITLMTWMQHGTSSEMARIAAAIAAGFLLGGGQLDHAIVNSLLMFSGLHTGHSPFGYLQWARTAGWAALGNLAGGIGLVTLLRLFQVPHIVGDERRHPAPGVPIGDPPPDPVDDSSDGEPTRA